MWFCFMAGMLVDVDCEVVESKNLVDPFLRSLAIFGALYVVYVE